MFKFAVVIFVVIVYAAAKPDFVSPLGYTAPFAIVAAPAPVVTATSSQVIARNYNGIASAPIVASVAFSVSVVAKTVAPVDVATPLAYTTPFVSKYAASSLHP